MTIVTYPREILDVINADMEYTLDQYAVMLGQVHPDYRVNESPAQRIAELEAKVAMLKAELACVPAKEINVIWHHTVNAPIEDWDCVGFWLEAQGLQ